MFVQIVSGEVGDRVALRRQFQHWADELRSGAVGFLGGTAGLAADGEFVGVARFENEQAARSNCQRPEQAAWWRETERCFVGPIVVRESNDHDLLANGGSDRAGFVQVIEGRTQHRATFMELERHIEKGFLTERPDFIGSMLVWWPDGSWLEVAYFCSEAETRAAEHRGTSAELTKIFAEWRGLAAPSSYFDINQPWMIS